MRHVFAWLCDSCQHLASDHVLMEGGVLDGPYLCGCGCAIIQESPMTALDRRRFEERFPEQV